VKTAKTKKKIGQYQLNKTLANNSWFNGVYFIGDLLIWIAIVGLPIGLMLWMFRKLMLRLLKRKSINP